MKLLRSIAEPGPRAKTWLHRIGTALGVAGIVFVAQRLYVYQSDLSFDDWGAIDFVVLAALCVAFAAGNILLALGWHTLLSFLDARQSFGWSLRTYAVTQLAKYLPGNVLQFAGRQAIGASVGISHSTLIKSSMMEILLLVSAGACFAPLIVPVFVPAVTHQLAISIFLVVAIVYATALTLRASGYFTVAAFSYAAQVIVSSSIFVGVFLLAGGTIDGWSETLTIMGSFVVSWLAGLLTPGAPAGLGVREASLAFLLLGIAPAPVVLTAALLGRFVTTLGDLLFFLVGRKTG